MAISVTQVKDRMETDLPDSMIQTVIDAEREAVDRRHGAGSITEVQDAKGSRFLVVKRKIDTITSITERRWHTSDTADTLSANDYRNLDGFRLFRLDSGDNPASDWGEEVTITYTPVLDSSLRDRIVLDLVQLSVEFRAYESEDSGDWSGDQGDYEERREAIMGQLREPRRLVT